MKKMTLAMLLGLVVVGCEPKPAPKVEAPAAKTESTTHDEAAPAAKPETPAETPADKPAETPAEGEKAPEAPK